MPERDILQLGNPELWRPSAEIADPRSDATARIVADLSDTLAAFRRDTGFGRAIAAPQIGIHERVIFLRVLPDGFTGPLINPTISEASSETFELWDDCFSFPELMVRVRRHVQVTVRYVDDTGRSHVLDASGDLSELVQHEIDHLDGILAVDRAIARHAFMTRAEWTRQRSLERA